MQSVNLNQVNVLNILFMANEIYTGESDSVGVNEKRNFEIFKKNQPKKNKNLVIN